LYSASSSARRACAFFNSASRIARASASRARWASPSMRWLAVVCGTVAMRVVGVPPFTFVPSTTVMLPPSMGLQPLAWASAWLLV